MTRKTARHVSFTSSALAALLTSCNAPDNAPSGSAGGAGTLGGALVTNTSAPSGGSSSSLKSAGGTSTDNSISLPTGGGSQRTGDNSTASGNASAVGGKAAGGKSSASGTVGTASRGGANTVGGTSSLSSKATGGTSAGGTSAAGGTASTADVAAKPFKGVANSNCAQRTALNVSWYYNWETAPREPCSSPTIGGEYVPMIKGHQHRTPEAVAGAITSIVIAGYKTVLGFNEPNKSDQGNQTVDLSVSLWPSMLDSALRVGSPATSAERDPGQVWFTSFMNQVSADPAQRVDFIAIHWYGWEAGSCDANASQLENYIKWAEGFPGNRPIWITEFGCSNKSNPDEATVVAFFKGVLSMFARHPRIERYAWYPWIANNRLVNEDGTLTSLGTVFAAAPAHK